MAVDLTNKPRIFEKFKVQSNTKFDGRKLVPVIGVILFNQLVVNFLMISFVAYFRKMPSGNYLRHTQSFPELIIEILMFEFIYEFLFYYAHRLMHHKLFYNKIHKLHHSWTGMYSFSDEFKFCFKHFEAIQTLFIDCWLKLI